MLVVEAGEAINCREREEEEERVEQDEPRDRQPCEVCVRAPEKESVLLN